MLKLGIAGAGFIGEMHARNAARSNAVELVAVAGARGAASAERFVAELGGDVRAVSLEELLEDAAVEAVLLATRTSDHAEHAVRVLEAGKHLLLEKPGAITLTEQQSIRDAAARHPELVVRVAYHRRHDPRFRELAALIADRRIGTPYAAHSISREDYPPSAEERYAGGFIMDVGVHDFDTARWLLGSDPARVFAAGQSAVYEHGGADNVYITIDYADAAATVQLSRTSRVGLEVRFEVLGADGTALLYPGTASPAGMVAVTTTREFPVDCRTAFPEAYPAELRDFAAAVRGEPAPGATLTDDHWAVATAVAARASVEQGSALEVGPDWEWSGG
ncbi:MAG: Gfo/Idh/MocA family protein [Solirubrobacteraceae bacterium]